MTNIFDWVSETFHKPRMQSTPSVVDQGTYTYDPEVAAAAQVMMPPEMSIAPDLHRNGPPAGHVNPEQPKIEDISGIDRIVSGDEYINYPASADIPPLDTPPQVQTEIPQRIPGPEGYNTEVDPRIPSVDTNPNMPPDPSLFQTEVDENGMPREGGGIPQLDGDLVDENGIPLDPYGNHIDPNNPNGQPVDGTFRGQVGNPDGRGVAGAIPMHSQGINNDGTMAPTQTPAPGMPQPGEVADVTRANDPAPDQEPLPGLTDPVTDDDPPITPEEAEKAKDVFKDATPVNGVTKEDAAKVAAEDPRGFKKAMTWFENMTGLTGQDLTRMGLLYAGSRIAGYDHSGSMSWAFETGMTMTAAREAMLQGLTKDGKYTPASIEEFKKTNDRSKLKLTTSPNVVKTDFTAPKIGKDGARYYKRTDKTGNTWYETTGGKRSDGAGLQDPSDPQTRVEMINDAAPAATSIIGAVMDQNGLGTTTKGVPDNPNWGIVPEVAGPAAMEIILDMAPNIPNSEHLNSAMYTRVVKNAIEAAAADTRRGKKVNDIGPYVVAQLQYYNNDGKDNGWKQSLMRKGEKLSTEEWFDVRNSVMGAFKNDPAYAEMEKQYGAGQLTDAIFSLAFKKFQTEVPLEKRKNDPNAFFSWIQRNIQ